MRRLLQRTLGVGLMGILLGTPFLLPAQGKKGSGHSGGSRGGSRKKSGTRKKGGN
jgi:hypothetical protein